MALRLFIFLVVLVLTMLIGVIAILLVSGTFTAGLAQSEKLVQNELTHLANDISQQSGMLSQHAVEFARSLSNSIEEHLRKQRKSTISIKDQPDLLEDLLSKEFERSLSALLRSNSSGVFIILDATVNPDLPNANYSKAGLYIKNMEPNIISSFSPNIHILRGFPSIARSNSLPLHSQWDMEFDVFDAPYFKLPLQASKDNSKLSLSKLYYWTPPLLIPGTSEEVMLCSVPLIDSNGNAFGVCGFDMSAMLFKLSHMPNNSQYTRAFSMLFTTNNNDIRDTEKAMISGGYFARISSKHNSTLKIIKSKNSFYSYEGDGGNHFLGFHTPIKMYPNGSYFSDEQWMAAIMIPKNDIVKSISRLNILLSSLLILLLAIGVTVSFFLSRSYVKPIFHGFNIIKSDSLPDNPRTKVPEIDDLMDFLTANKERLHQQAQKNEMPVPLLDEFMENTKTLSPAERAVFNLYVQEHTAKEIADILSLSINTIKTHNKRIYMKLNVGSREELLLYINMLKEIGQEFK